MSDATTPVKCHDCPAIPSPGKTRCRRCLDLLAARARIARAKRAAEGACLYCTRPRLGALHYCAVHRQQVATARRGAKRQQSHCRAKRRSREDESFARLLRQVLTPGARLALTRLRDSVLARARLRTVTPALFAEIAE